ncbi:transposase [Streptomyces sp. NPDC056534]|uniref:transposase n=1 Tax=Streptomyces sp. NPDC056534 TaxID=3345857 RepID=UPI0036B6C84D
MKPGVHSPGSTSLLLKEARKSFSWQDYRDLLVRAHIQLGSPTAVVWDNLNTHLATGLKRYEAEHDWLTTVRLPAYAPDLNPVEAFWSLMREPRPAPPSAPPPRLPPHTPPRATQNPPPAPPHQRMPHRHRLDPHTTDPTMKISVGRPEQLADLFRHGGTPRSSRPLPVTWLESQNG